MSKIWIGVMVAFSTLVTAASASAPSGSAADRMAHERYGLLHYAAGRLGVLPLSTMIGDYSWTVLFPIGRSDRMYLDITSPYGMTTGMEGDYLVYCYQRKAGHDKLVYGISMQTTKGLTVKDGQSVAPKGYATLLDYLTEGPTYSVSGGGISRVVGYSLPDGTSRYAREDLSTRRDYVMYEYYPVIDTLKVTFLSGTDGPTEYSLNSEDPKTGIQNPVAFYNKHGLPIAKAEAARLKRAL